MNLLNNDQIIFAPLRKKLKLFQSTMRRGSPINDTVTIKEIRGNKQPIEVTFRLRISDRRYSDYLYRLISEDTKKTGKFTFVSAGPVAVTYKNCEILDIVREHREDHKRVTFKVKFVCSDIGPKPALDLVSSEYYVCPEYRIPIGFKEIYRVK